MMTRFNRVFISHRSFDYDKAVRLQSVYYDIREF